jgi:DNA-binding response OmpR family regulator
MVKKKTKIMIVDDEKNLVDMVREILEAENYKVIEAFTASECLKILKKEKVDLILLDIMMPKIDGWMLHRQIKEDPKLGKIPIIILTAKADDIDKRMGLEVMKVDDYILKPFVPEDLINRINEILSRKI